MLLFSREAKREKKENTDLKDFPVFRVGGTREIQRGGRGSDCGSGRGYGLG